MDYPNLYRAREGQCHIEMKEDACPILRQSGYPVILPETKYCDIVAIRIFGGKLEVLATELEFTPRNVLRNAQRNFDNGCDATLVIASTEQVHDSCVRKLKKYLSEEYHERTYVAPFQVFKKYKGAFILPTAPLYSSFIRQKLTLYSGRLIPLFAEKHLYSLPFNISKFSHNEENGS